MHIHTCTCICAYRRKCVDVFEEDRKPHPTNWLIVYPKDKSKYGPSSDIWHDVRLCGTNVLLRKQISNQIELRRMALRMAAVTDKNKVLKSIFEIQLHSMIPWLFIRFQSDFSNPTVTNILWHCRIGDNRLNGQPLLYFIYVHILHNTILFRFLWVY